MLYSGKNFTLCATKKINILTRVVRKKILNETKNHTPPPCKLNGRSLTNIKLQSAKCYTKPVSKLLTPIQSAVKTGFQRYCDTS